MSLYTTFGEILTATRAEARLSTNPAVGPDANVRYKTLINRVYATLYDDYDWSHLRYQTPRVAISAGQRYYNMPAGIDANRIEEFIVWWSGEPVPVDPGIGPKEYAAFSSIDDERADPVLRYDLRSTSEGVTQIELWPVPSSSDMTFQITGPRAWAKLVNSSDICLLDDHLVSLYAATEILRPISREDADQKLAAAGARLRQLRGRSVKSQTAGDSAPSVGTGPVSVGLRGNKAIVRIGGS